MMKFPAIKYDARLIFVNNTGLYVFICCGHSHSYKVLLTLDLSSVESE